MLVIIINFNKVIIMHLGIIMDGNGRWAVQRRLPRAFGHKRGASRVTEIVRICPDLNIKTLTFICFFYRKLATGGS